MKVEIAPNATTEKVEVNKSKDETKILAPGDENQALGILESSSISSRNGSLKGSSGILATNLGESTLPPVGTRSDYQAHHIISTSSANKSTAAKAASQSGYDINRALNGIWLPSDLEISKQVQLPLHKGRHLGKYFRTVDTILDNIKDRAIKAKNSNKPWDEIKMLDAMSKAENNLRAKLVDLDDPTRLQKRDPVKPVDPDPKGKTF